MKKIFKLKPILRYLSLDENGIVHWSMIAPVALVVIVAAIGIHTFKISHASTPQSPTVEHVSYVSKAVPPLLQPDGQPEGKKNNQTSGICLATAQCYYYVNGHYGSATNPLTASGASVSITQAQPRINSKDEHSAAELWVGSANSQNAVEIGWTVSSQINGDLFPHLFVYHWVNGVASCYNGCGFVPTSTVVTTGQPVAVGVVGNYSIQFKSNEWMLSYNGTPFGYFPGSLWKNSPSGPFNVADFVQAFGEVESGSTLYPQSQMGSALLGTYSKSSAFSNFSLIGDSTQPNLATYSSPPTYTAGLITANGFNFGGPGYKSDTDAYLNLSGPIEVNPPNPYDLEISTYAVPTPGDTIASFDWDWGDGTKLTIPGTTAVITPTHTYAKIGTYNIKVSVLENIQTGKPDLKTKGSEKIVIR